MIHISKYWAKAQKTLPHSESRRLNIDNSYMITKHPHWTSWDLLSQYEKDFLTKKLKTNSMSKTKFTVAEAADIFSKTLGADYLFTQCECKVDSLQDIRELLFIRGFTHDDWRDDGAKRIPNDYVIKDLKSPDGFKITQNGMEYILRHNYLFKLTKYEKSCTEEYNC